MRLFGATWLPSNPGRAVDRPSSRYLRPWRDHVRDAFWKKRLWAGNNPANLMYRRLHETIVPLRTLSSEIPEVLSDLVERCLANDPLNCFPTVKQIPRCLLFALFPEQHGDPL